MLADARRGAVSKVGAWGVGVRLAEWSSGGPTGESGPVTVILVDDQALIRSAVRQALSAAGLQVVGEADNAKASVQTTLDVRPDVVLMDLSGDGASGVQAIERISSLAPASRILVLITSKKCDYLLEAIVAGASGYILKDSGFQAIVNGVRASAAGECVISPELAGDLIARIHEQDIRIGTRDEQAAHAIRTALTERELEIFKRLASGESNREIGCTFSLSENTVKNHVASILAKLHLDNRVQAAVQAVRGGFSCIAGLFLLEALSDEADIPSAVVSFLLRG
jgi:NarL family two-component system response regulator LiaR